MSRDTSLSDTLLVRYPDLAKHQGELYLVKYGGAAMDRNEVKDAVCREIAALSQLGIRVVVVHGGGKEITHLLEQLSIESKFIGGVRVTSSSAMKATEMVLSGSINKELASTITRYGAPALGISGRDAHIIEASTYRGPDGGDFGETGDVATCNPKPITALLEGGFVPVVSPIGENEEGRPKNINADYAAAAVAGSIKALNCIFLTDVDGVRTDAGVQQALTAHDIEELIQAGVITGGMIPKVMCALKALNAGCPKATICNAGLADVVTKVILGDAAIGTVLRS
jgi:acetylglutamate kinase